MNRFRTKKKAKDDLAASRTSEDSEQSSFRGFLGRKKVQQEEAKKEFDLSTALPSTDDFRTSLLMSNLSARFSMLREQDDPNTKIGKASDDSVLYPKRQSRMAEFGFSNNVGLTDIAEVESIKAAGFLRKDSFTSDETAGGSVMNRSKPIEGNNLFGGRQKIYKIPAGAKSSGGGMTGRALYDDDVAMSAFQRWRLAERERSRERESSAERGSAELDRPEDETEPARAPSPVLSAYNRKRETASTTSSASILARNSTAATSITSQVTGSVKDAASFTTPTSTTPSVAGSDRLVTRTRKLYEQGLTQDMQEQQSSALSKIDTLARQRPFGSRTPDLAASSPSSAVSVPLDRSISERRALLAKASAPNMRFASSSAASASTSPVDSGAKAPSQPEAKPTFGGVPPLSPPMSETGEVPILPIQPNDIGKATALGMFQKPSQPYDESRFAERQILMKQGREAPAQSLRAEPDAATHPLPSSVGQEEGLPPTPVPDSELSIVNLAATLLTPELNIERPADEDHPAFRQSALPTPLSVNGKTGQQPPTTLQEQSAITVNKLKDSPTLGIPTSGLSGMVRQHLRSESNTSSIFEGGRPQTSGHESRFNLGESSLPLVEDLASRSNPWMNTGHEWAVSYYGNKEAPKSHPQENHVVETKESDQAANVTEAETDEFASQLADARRRVREKLTSFVESDSSRPGSSRPPSASSKDFGSTASSTSLGLGILKTSSSLSSLVDRSRGTVANQPKPAKMLGIGSATMSSSPQPSKESFDEKDLQPLETMKEETPREAEARVSSESANNDEDESSAANPGLRAFRQARRELQKRRELETLARHQMSQTSQPRDQSLNQPFVAQPPPRADRSANSQRTPSRERKPPPVAYRQRAPSDEQRYHSSPGRSGERDRSGSESGGRSNSRPPRAGAHIRPQDQLTPGARQPTMRSPGLPGTDIKGSPIMPPHPYPGRGVPSPAPSPHLNQSRSIGNLAVHTGRLGFDAHPGQPSPISPMGLPSPAPYAAPAQPGSPIGNGASFGSRPRQSSTSNSPALGPVNGGFYGQVKRMVDKRDISEPTFMSSTTRVPTMNLPQQRPSDMSDRGRSNPSSQSRSNSRGPVPPVPPINPRRMRQGPDEAGLVAPRLPYVNQANNSTTSLDFEENRSAFSISEDEAGGKPDRRRLRKAPPTDAQGLGTRGPGGKVSRDNSPPYLAKGPLKNRTTMNMGPGGMI
ncbi:hypothetical protein QBC42DRAFT_328444 [Cladorrhinum samala]|uniref:Uncharacterized protein n=1 Tax=Cladorrhinum samala TaxID=585594 RepID=A0AAV9HM79_9PEZI|nr:hypothetical protein QBC42DRAFT_328444 [Cladorrhinum samala]